MVAWVLLLIIAVALLWRTVSSLKDRIAFIETQLEKSATALESYRQRVMLLERGAAEAQSPTGAPEDTQAAVVPAAPTPVPTEQRVARPSPEAARPAVIEPEPPIIEAPIPEEAAGPLEPSAPPVAAEPAASESWEMVVGTSWLNKIGVLVSIIGVALIVSYSFTHIGPAGRVSVGYLLSLAMLGAGVLLERRPLYRNYAYGLVAGGWAGVYFTTFAMHDIPAARIIDSDLLGVSLLSAVAVGMVAHSLRYRSQVVTSLAYIVAYATLALSPLSGFSLVSSVPLAMSVLVVSQRFGWSGVSTLGIVSTYGVFLLRQTLGPGGPLDSYAVLPYLTITGYWVTFEVADILGLRFQASHKGAADGPAGQTRAEAAAGTPVPMFALNAVGLFGVSLLLLPAGDPVFVSNFLAVAGAAYLASAFLRARLLPSWPAAPDGATPFTSRHGAAAIAAALFAWAIDLRFAGNRETLALLVETELLVTAGLTLGDPWIRRLGAAGALVTTAHAWVLGVAGQEATIGGPWPMAPTSAVLCLIALAWYANREALHRRVSAPDRIERGYSWAATALLSTVFVVELAPAHQGLAGLLLAFVLLEVSFRRGFEIGAQSYLLNVVSAMAVLLVFLAPDREALLPGWGAAPGEADIWLVLPAAVMLTFGYAVRLFSRRNTLTPEAVFVAGASAGFATALLAVFEWRVLAPAAVAPMWAGTAVALVLAGGWRRISALRWQGYALVLLAGHRAVMPLTLAAPASGAATASIALVIAGMYVAGYLGGRAVSTRLEAGSPALEAELAVTNLIAVVGTASFALFKWRVLPDNLIGPAWAATAIVLVSLGAVRRRPGQRWQGYALAIVAAGRVGLPLLDHPAPLASALWAGVVAGLLYAVAHLANRMATAPPPADGSPAIRGRGELAAARLLLSLATLLLAAVQARLWADPLVGPIWTATAAALLGAGLWRRVPDLRWQGYALLFAGALRTAAPLLRAGDATAAEILWMSVVILTLYAVSLVVRDVTRTDSASSSGLEEGARTALLLCATAMLAALILREMPHSLVTPALGLQGIALLFVGIPTHERALRLSGLAVLLICILKLFLLDLRELEALARIFSFVVLGLFLLAVSWTYTRYREQIRRYL